MLIFGPFHAIPLHENFVVFNLSSPTESIPKLPGLFVLPDSSIASDEKSFDIWYYNYLLENSVTCTSLMQILNALYETGKVYICIADYSVGLISTLNESFMKFLQCRYGIKYSVINTISDYQYVPKDGCDFRSVSGILTFDEDRKRYFQLIEEYRLLNGGINV